MERIAAESGSQNSMVVWPAVTLLESETLTLDAASTVDADGLCAGAAHAVSIVAQ
jgi:hypothetical protein